jgi:hypothetical protein
MEQPKDSAIEPDFAFFMDSNAVSSGVMLFEKSTSGLSSKGRVIFSILDLPVSSVFLSERGLPIL